MDGEVYASTLWDADGPGPLEPALVVGGRFDAAGNKPVGNVAALNITTREWAAMGGGIVGKVYAFAATANGELFAGGEFLLAGETEHSNIARWDGAEWTHVGAGFGAQPNLEDVFALAVLPNGDLVAGGEFDQLNGAPVNHVARWDGQAWHPLGSGVNGRVHALREMPNGDIIASGEFDMAGGKPAYGMARWDGAEWREMGLGVQGSSNGLALTPDGRLVAARTFSYPSAVTGYRVATWNGGDWTPISEVVNKPVESIVVLPGGEIAVAGGFARLGPQVSAFIARYGCPPDACYADCDGSGVLDIFDFLCFASCFSAGSSYADCDGNGTFDLFDFLCFQNEFAAGCG